MWNGLWWKLGQGTFGSKVGGTFKREMCNSENYAYQEIYFFAIESIQSWGTQKECFAPKSFSRHYFEWPLHLQNNLFGIFSFFVQYSHFLY